MSTIQNSDLFLFNRNETSYKVTAEDIAKHTNDSVNIREFIAKGTIPNGMAVVVNDDGTVSVITQTPLSAGPEVVFNTSGYNSTMSAVYDSANQKVVIAWRNSTTDAKAVVGTVSGTSISFGSPVKFADGDILNPRATYDSTNNKVVIAYSAGSVYSGIAIVGTVSGTSISFGSPVTFTSDTALLGSAVYDSINNKVVIAYSEGASSPSGAAIVGTVSGTSISFGSKVVFNSNESEYISAAYDSSNNKVVIAYTDRTAGNNKGTAIVGAVSGTSISFGSPVIFHPVFSDALWPSLVHDSINNKVVIAYRDQSIGGFGNAIVGTVSGTSISFGSRVTISQTNTFGISATYDFTSNKVVIAYTDNSNQDHGNVTAGTVSGTSISFDSSVKFNSDRTSAISTTYDSANNKVVIVYQDGYSSLRSGTAKVLDIIGASLTSENYIGIAEEAISDGATGKITTAGGVNSQQTGLETARKYYVQNDGSLGLTPDSTSVIAGTSISSTEIIVQYYN